MPGHCHFKTEWLKLSTPEFIQLWLRGEENSSTARCTFCNKNFNVSNSGIAQVKSHASGKLHMDKINAHKNSRLFVNQDSTATKNLACTAPSTVSENLSQPSGSTISSHFLKDDVIKAEILWSLHRVMSHQSLRSGENGVALFPLMFPDSVIASKVELKKDKLAYNCTFGLGPYFQNELANFVKKCDSFSVSFDESLNKIAQKGQMDIFVRVWDERRAVTRYLTSTFLGIYF